MKKDLNRRDSNMSSTVKTVKKSPAYQRGVQLGHDVRVAVIKHAESGSQNAKKLSTSLKALAKKGTQICKEKDSECRAELKRGSDSFKSCYRKAAKGTSPTPTPESLAIYYKNAATCLKKLK
jgi:hypothetical protein